MPNVVAILPARWGSTRFPGKPLHMLAGKPLIQHAWERCRRARSLAGVIVATDDARIAEVAREFGADVEMTSPRHQSGTDRVAEVAKKLSGVSHILNVQGDEPLIDPRLIDRLARAMIADKKIEMITAAREFSDREDMNNPNAVKVVADKNSDALYFSRSVIPFPREGGTRARHWLHLGVYGYSKNFLLRFVRWKVSPLEKIEKLEQLRALENGARIRVLVTKNASIGVDTPEDAERVERMLKTAR